MKKLFKTLILCLLVLTMSISAFACGGEEEAETIEPVKKYSFEGTHIRNQTETGKYVVKDGATDYKLVVTNSTLQYITEAKSDFILLFSKATGVSIEAVLDTDVPDYTEESKYISLGATKLVSQAGIPEEEYSMEKLGWEGVRIITKGNSIFLLGAQFYGVNYSVYTLFEMMFNFEIYQRDCIYIDRNVYNVPLMNYDVTELPDVKFGSIADRSDWRGTAVNGINVIDSLYYGANAQEEVSYRGARARSANYAYGDLTIQAYPTTEQTGGGKIHNILTAYLDKSLEGLDPDWFSQSGSQACFTARGNAKKLDAFVEHCVKIIMQSVVHYPTAKYPETNFISITCSDGSTTTCMCEACTKIAEANNGAYIASHIMFLNRVSARVAEEFEKNKDKDWYRENFQVYIFAYGITRQPPVYYDEETDTFTPTSDAVVCGPNSSIYYVGGNGWYSMYDEKMTDNRDYLRGWDACTPDSYLWYWTNAGNNNSMIPYDALAVFNNDYYEYLAYCDVDLAYISQHFTYELGTSFTDLSFYISKKLRWNCHLDMNELERNYYENMYGDAADIMEKLYETLKCYWYTVQDYLEEQNLMANAYMYKKELWPYDFNLMWYNEVQKAVAAVSDPDYMESDPNGYAVLVHRIQLEAIAPLYNIIYLHGKGNPREINDQQLADYKAALYEIVQHHPNMNAGASMTKPIVLAQS